MTTDKQMRLEELKALVRAWKRTRSVRTATDICEFLVENIDLGEEE